MVIEATAACRPVRTGIARYTVRLVEGLAALAREETGDRLRLALRVSRWKERRHCYRPPGLPALWYAEPLWPPWVREDVAHGTDARVPAWRGPARLATVHDCAVLLYPDYSSDHFRRRKEVEWQRLAATADALIADSEATRQDFSRLFGVPLKRIHTVPLGVDEALRPVPPSAAVPLLAGLGLAPPYLLYLGELSRRKNVERLVQGYAASRAARELPLVLAGPDSFGSERLSELIARLGLASRVRRLGFVPDEALPALYSAAAAFVFPTEYEGFGLPLLEAMACGTPVLAGNRGAAPETTGGHAALADPAEPDSIAAGIDAALERTRAQRNEAQAYAAAFTWERCARATRAVYQAVTGKA